MASVYGPPGSEILDQKTGEWFGLSSFEEQEAIQHIYTLRRGGR